MTPQQIEHCIIEDLPDAVIDVEIKKRSDRSASGESEVCWPRAVGTAASCSLTAETGARERQPAHQSSQALFA